MCPRNRTAVTKRSRACTQPGHVRAHLGRTAIEPAGAPSSCRSAGRTGFGSCATARAPATSPATPPSPRGLPRIDLTGSRRDVTLSPRGREQSDALGRWFAALPDDAPPRRAARLALHARPPDRRTHRRARRRRARRRSARASTSACARRNSASSTHLTRYGIEQELPRASRVPPRARQVLPPPARRRELVRRDPAPAQRARHDQPALWRPPGHGRGAPGGRPVHALPARGAGRGRDPGDRPRKATSPIAAITEYDFDPANGPTGGLVLRRANFTAPMEREGTPVTAEPDRPVAVR